MSQEVTVLTKDQVERLLEAAPDTYAGARTRAMIALMFRTGLRIGEVLGLELGDVREADGTWMVRVSRPKGFAKAKSPSHPRTIGIDRRTVDVYRAWMRVRGARDGALFCNRHGKQMTRQPFGRVLASLARRAGIEGRVHPHCLRHSAAHDVLFETRDLTITMMMLGHQRVGTTDRYLRQIGAPDGRVVDALAGREW